MARTKQAGRESTRKRKAAEASESDDGFISADEGTAPKSKKTKTATASKSSSDAKEPSWDLGSSKRATISEFKGNTYINIREYYQKNGEFLPGKKGVMLNLECWSELVKCAGEINGKLGEKGLLVEGGEEEEEKKGKVVAKVEKKKEKKSNIEVTSDEEEVEAEGGEEEDDD